MILRIFVVIALVASFAAAAAESDAPKYTPEIRGRLTHGGQVLPSNVCLRRSGTEIRQCGYTDFDGYFRIPSMGPTRPESAKVGDTRVRAYPTFWLELGTGYNDVAVRLSSVEMVDDKKAIVELDCDVARDASKHDANDYCRSKRALPNATAQSRR